MVCLGSIIPTLVVTVLPKRNVALICLSLNNEV